MASEWDAIVVGGGIVGLSTAYALAQNGMERVLLLERYVIGSGTTTWGTGAVQVHRFSRVDTEVVNRSRLLMEELSKLVGPAFTYYQVGRVTLAPEADAAVLEESVELAKECGIEVSILSDSQLETVVPGINTKDLGLATFSTVDGRVYSNTLACALAGAARDAGVSIWEGAEVARLDLSADGNIQGVMVGRDQLVALKAPHVVVAGGAWTRNVLVASRLNLPTQKRVARTASVMIDSDCGCEVIPTFMDTVHQLTYIPRNEGLMQLGGHQTGIVVPPEDDLTQGNSRLPHDQLMSGFDDMRASLVSRLPGWEFGPILGGWNGMIDISPDGQPMIGAYPGINGLWVNDTAGYGLMRALGVGEAVADMIAGKETQMDVEPWSLSRLSTLAPPANGATQSSDAFIGIATLEPAFVPTGQKTAED